MKTIKYTLLSLLVVAIGFGIWLPMKKTESKSQNTNTELVIVNSTGYDSLVVYLTLNGYGNDSTLAPLYVQDVNGIFGITNSGLKGSFILGAGDSVFYTSTKRLAGNIGFGTEPINCPTDIWKTGANIFEFNLNVPQESCDIGCVTGVNSIINAKLIGGPNWQASQYYPNVREIQNDTMYANTNRVGVMPYGCTNCVNTEGKQPCQTPSETPDSARVCNPTKTAGARGGQVIVTFKKYTNWQICK
jgi:hypothetical protein